MTISPGTNNGKLAAQNRWNTVFNTHHINYFLRLKQWTSANQWSR